MLRSGQKIRLTREERLRLEAISGITACGIHSIDALDAYIETSKAIHDNGSLEGKLLGALLEDEKIQD